MTNGLPMVTVKLRVVGFIARICLNIYFQTLIVCFLSAINAFYDQGNDYSLILSLLVEAAIHWMEIGLLLRILKIVVYTKDLKQVKDDPMVKHFSSLKQNWLKKQARRKESSQVYSCVPEI